MNYREIFLKEDGYVMLARLKAYDRASKYHQNRTFCLSNFDTDSILVIYHGKVIALHPLLVHTY